MVNKQISEKLGETVAQVIKEARERKGWTMYQLWQQTGVDVSNISRIEKNQVCPRIDTLNVLCDALDILITLPLRV